MASAWLIMTVLAVHVALVSAVFRPTTKDELNYAISSCLTNNASGVQCCAASPYCNAGPGTASFTDDIGDWDTSLITDMSMLFLNKASFNADISRWNTSKVTTMGDMFWGAKSFNQPIGNLDTSQVRDMNDMFGHTDAFNQDITGWDTAKMTFPAAGSNVRSGHGLAGEIQKLWLQQQPFTCRVRCVHECRWFHRELTGIL